MENKQYEFYGVDFKTELLLGLMTGIILIIIWPGLVYSYYTYNHLDSIIRIPKRIFFGSMFLGVAISLLLLRGVAKYLKRKWKVISLKDYVLIEFNNKSYKVLYNEINKMTLNGRNDIRYLTIAYLNKKIKMRIGTNSLMPFSNQEDIKSLDIFWQELEKYLPNKYCNVKLNESLIPKGTLSITYHKNNERA